MAGRHRIEMEPGTRHGRLTVVRYVGRAVNRDSQYLCVCDCGRETVVGGYLLRSGRTLSCGCYRTERCTEAKRAKAEARRRAEHLKRERLAAERRSAEFAERMTAYNQRAGERFDDMWMFGDCHAVARLKTMFR